MRPRIFHIKRDTTPWITSRKEGTTLLPISNYTVPLSEVAEVIAEGIVTGKNDIFLIDAYSPLGEALQAEGLVRPALRGESVDRYTFSWDGTLLIYPYVELQGKTAPLSESELRHKAPATYEYLRGSRGQLSGRPWFDNSSKEWFELWNQRDFHHQSEAKLVIQENSVRCELNLDKGHYFYLDTCCGISLSTDTKISYGYLLALLNSTVLDGIFRQLTVPKAQGHFIHKPMFLRRLPIRRIYFGSSASERKSLVGQLARLHERGRFNDLLLQVRHLLLPQSGTSPSANPPQADKSDVIHDLLDLLAHKMIEINSRMKAEIDAFLSVIGRLVLPTAGASPLQNVERLKGKSVLRQFAGAYEKGQEHISFDRLWEILVANRRLLPNLDGSSKSKLCHAYDKSLETVLPVKRLLRETDSLIDQIVYLLYGLVDNVERDQVSQVSE